VNQPATLDYAPAAAYLGLSLPTLRRGVRAGSIPHVKYGRRVLFPIAALDQWLADQARASLRQSTAMPAVPVGSVRRRRSQKITTTAPQPLPPAPRSPSGRVRPFRDGDAA